MSETKTFEELFLSENNEDNQAIKEIDILLVSDLHKNYNYMEKLKEWTVENKKLFNFIFCTGDMLNLNYPENDDNHEIAKSEAELCSMINFLENMCLNVIYLGGNHDPKSLFNIKDTPTLTVRSTNIHKKYMKVANDLYIIGLGGSIPAIESLNSDKDSNFIPYTDVTNKVVWQGYPYNNEHGNSNYKISDDIFKEDLIELWKKSKMEIEEGNTTKNIKYLFLTHVGPFYSNTTLISHKNKCVYSGSQNLQDFFKENPEIFINIHGHTHTATGMSNYSNLTIINPGSLSCGDFALLKLKRDMNNCWVISKIEFLKFI